MTRVYVLDGEVRIPEAWSVWTYAGSTYRRNRFGTVQQQDGELWVRVSQHWTPPPVLAAKEGEDVLDCSGNV